MRGGRAAAERARVLIIVQNLPVPFDRRVWLECRTLARAGLDVSVVCPRGSGTGRFQVVEGVSIHGYRPYAPGGSALGFVLEYAYSFLATLWLVLRARRGGRFAVLQACNPPDIFWPIARLLRLRDGTRFVFDHHDLCPELFRSRFADGSRVALRALLALERQTFLQADHVVSTNTSYARVAVERGGKPPSEVSVVRTGPDLERLRPVDPDPALRRGHRHLVAYLGVMGPQDGVDIVIAAADLLVNRWGRRDVAFTVMGDGDSRAALVAERDRRGLHDVVELPGRVSDATMVAVLSTADVGLSPDPSNPLNDVSTMNKTMEYMALGLPVLSFDLPETRVSAAGAAAYVAPDGGAEAYARALAGLLDDPARRAEMSRTGRERVEQELAWVHQQETYLGVVEDLIGRGSRVGESVGGPRVREG